MIDFSANSLWSNINFGFSFTNSIGMSGGIITLLRVGKVDVLHSFKGEGFFRIKVV